MSKGKATGQVGSPEKSVCWYVFIDWIYLKVITYYSSNALELRT